MSTNVPAERPHPCAVAVELRPGPWARNLAPLDSEPAVEYLPGGHPLGVRVHDAGAPGEKGLRARLPAGGAHRVGGEGAGPKPRVSIWRRRGRGEVGTRLGLVLPDDGDAPGGKPVESHFTEPARSPCTK